MTSQRCISNRPAWLVALSTLLLAAWPSFADVGRSPLIDLQEFQIKPAVMKVELSPDGERLAYALRTDHGATIGLLDAATGAKRQLFASRMVTGLHWSSDGQALFLETRSGLAVAQLDRPSSTTEIRPRLIWQFDAEREQELLGVDPVRPRHLMISERQSGDQYRVLSLNAAGEATSLLDSDEPIRRFALDDQGRVQFVQGVDGLQVVIYRVDLDGSRKELYRCDVGNACGLETVIDGGRRLILSHVLDSSIAGRRLWGLASLDVASGAVTTLHIDPDGVADLSSVVVDRHRRPVLAHHHTEERKTFALDATLRAPLERLRSRFAHGEIVVEGGPNQGFWLITERAAQHQHPRYHQFNPQTGETRAILEAERLAGGGGIDEELLVERRHLSYRASDGMLVHGFVTVPLGVPASQAPMVVSVHGGPWGHDRSGYSLSSQLWANRGYVVFEPNFRGSTGYGFAYLRAARGDFGDGRVQQDILDGIDHLVASGLGDANRVAITGHSFGGFSTLGALAFTPGRFRVGVATAPAIDLVRALGDIDERETYANGLPLRKMVRELLVDVSDPQAVDRLRAQSPERHLAATVEPLLIVAGALDAKVDIVDVRHYAAALDALGRDVSLLVDRQAGHSFQSPRLRLATLLLTERLFARHLGGRSGTLDDPSIESYIERRLELTGGSLRQAGGGGSG